MFASEQIWIKTVLDLKYFKIRLVLMLNVKQKNILFVYKKSPQGVLYVSYITSAYCSIVSLVVKYSKACL